jgi:hypothetical protein
MHPTSDLKTQIKGDRTKIRNLSNAISLNGDARLVDIGKNQNRCNSMLPDKIADGPHCQIHETEAGASDPGTGAV